jgi:hypothetical protein
MFCISSAPDESSAFPITGGAGCPFSIAAVADC